VSFYGIFLYPSTIWETLKYLVISVRMGYAAPALPISQVKSGPLHKAGHFLSFTTQSYVIIGNAMEACRDLPVPQR